MLTATQTDRPHERTEAEVEVEAEAAGAIAACVVGAGIALSGFAPLNNVAPTLHIDVLPGFTLLTPAGLLTILACGLATRRSTRSRSSTPTLALVAVGLLLLGGCLSVTASLHVAQSISLLLLGVVMPACLFFAVRRGIMPPRILAGSFLAGLTAALAWADVVFLRANGLPTPSTLFAAKFTTRVHDFHYYTLGNPDHSATFLLLPLALCLVWLRDDGLSARARRLLAVATLMVLFTIVLLFVRLPLIVAFAMLLISLLRSGLRRRARAQILIVALVGAAWLVIASPSSYLTNLFSASKSSSGGVRLASISAGLEALSHHLLTGVGIGQYGASSGVPAHSSVIQAGAEMGIVGLLALLVTTVGLTGGAVIRVRQRNGAVLSRAALVATAVYALAAAVSAGADDGLFVGPVSIYGLSLALFVGIGLAPSDPPRAIALGEALATTRAALRNRRARTRRRGVPRWAWLAYGLAWTPIATVLITSRLPGSLVISGSRALALKEVILAHQHGFGPLVEMIGPQNFYPAGPTDDQGAYLVTPWLSGLLHTTNLNTIVRDAFVFGVCLMVLVYPLAMRRLTGSRLASLFSPPLVLAFFSFLTDMGFYWIPAVTVALCVPWLLIFVRERSAPVGPLVVIAMLAGLTQLFRSQTGLGILIGAIAVCLLAWQTRPRRVLLVAAVAGLYVGLSTGVLDLALQARASRMQSYPLTNNGVGGVHSWADASGHPLWHTLYIGLGVVPNRYGIRYSDSVAAAYVRTIDAAAPFVSPQYESILRARLIHLAVTDPGFVLKAERRKFGEILAGGLRRFWPLLILIPFVVAGGAGRRRRWRYAAVLIPTGLVAFLPPLVAVPGLEYELPWLGFLATVGILCGGWILRPVGARLELGMAAVADHRAAQPLVRLAVIANSRVVAARESLGRGATRIGHLIQRAVSTIITPFAWLARWPWRIARAAGAGGYGVASAGLGAAREPRMRGWLSSRNIFGLVVAVTAGFAVRGYLESWQASVNHNAAPLPAGAEILPYGVSLPAPLYSRQFSALPNGWVVDQGAQVRPGAVLRVSTSATESAYQLESSDLMLPAGRYMAAIRGELRSGGLELGVLDVSADKWVHVTSYSAISPPRRGTMLDDFVLTKREHVRIILSNYSNAGKPSDWRLAEALISPQGVIGVRRKPAIRLTLPPVGLPPGHSSSSISSAKRSRSASLTLPGTSSSTATSSGAP